MRWATKAHICAPAEAFVRLRCAAAAAAGGSGCDYEGAARRWLLNGYTPLFEWCEAGQAPGVMRHERR